jgi:hypothetical protein
MRITFGQKDRPSNKKYVEPEKKKPIKEATILFMGLACVGYAFVKNKPKY